MARVYFALEGVPLTPRWEMEVPIGGIGIVPHGPDDAPLGPPLDLFLELIRGSADSSYRWPGPPDPPLVRCYVETGGSTLGTRLRVTRLGVHGGRWPLVGLRLTDSGERLVAELQFPPLGREYPREGLGRLRRAGEPAWTRAWFTTNVHDLPPEIGMGASAGFKSPSTKPELDVARQIAENGFMAVSFEVAWAKICDEITVLDVGRRSYSPHIEYKVSFPRGARDDSLPPTGKKVRAHVEAACGPPPSGVLEPFALCRSLALLPHRVACLVGLSGAGCGWLVDAVHCALGLPEARHPRESQDGLDEPRPARTLVAQVPAGAVPEVVERARRRDVPVGVARYGA